MRKYLYNSFSDVSMTVTPTLKFQIILVKESCRNMKMKNQQTQFKLKANPIRIIQCFGLNSKMTKSKIEST